MKRYVTGLLVVALGVSLASSAVAYTGTYVPGAGINGTVHDLPRGDNGMGYAAMPADPLQRICIYCHAPHNTYKLSPANLGPGAGVGAGPQAPDAFDYLPLWNHELTANYPFYTMYQNGPGAPQSGPKASQAILNGGMEPGGVSLLCLSCHDGSVAVNSYGNSFQPTSSQSGGGGLISPNYVIGKDNYLGNHHPIGFSYDAVQAVDTEIRSADTASFTALDTVRDHLYGDSSSMMECATCHSVHNTGNSGESLLWRSDQNSELCLTCHAKGTYTAPTLP
jgi:predicted CXXCH cytochrome family protein